MILILLFVLAVILVLFSVHTKRSLTVVSAYYDIPSKKSSDIYHERLKQFLGKLDCDLVFFTSSDLVQTLKSYRSKYLHRTKFHVVELEDLECMKKYGLDFWKEQCAKSQDPAHVDKPLLGGIWYSKKEFLNRALQENPFGSTHLAWVDAGIMDVPYEQDVLHINEKMLDPDDRMHMYGIQKLTDDVYFDRPVNYLCGDTYYGTLEACEKHVYNYQKVFDQYVENDRCAFDDQYLLNSLGVLYTHDYNIDYSAHEWRFLFKKLVGLY